VKLYRTQVNGSVYTNVLANDQPIVVMTTQFTSSLVTDGASDAAILSNALLYGDGTDGTTPGNILDSLCPPALQSLIVHQNRLFGVDGNRIWPSKVYTTGEGVGFNEATAFTVDDGPGPVLALASMDDKLIIFKSDRLLFMTGLGPADNGTGNDWSPPQRIVSDVGCVDWRGIVTTPDGIYFQSPCGRRLLTRDLHVVPVPSVEDLDGANPVVTSAVIHPTLNRVVWTENTDDVTAPRSGIVLSHDYILKAWTSAAVNDSAGHASLGFVSACVGNVVTSLGPPSIIKPVLHLLRADGTVMREDIAGGTSLDTATAAGAAIFVPATWTSPWIKSDGLVGWSIWRMVRVALQVIDPAGLTISIAYDYNPAPVDVRTFTAAQIAARGTTLWIEEIQPTRPRAASLQITITDSSDPSTVTGAGFLFEGVRVDYDYETGGQRAPIAQRG
jgi:hypothetical protein